MSTSFDFEADMPELRLPRADAFEATIRSDYTAARRVSEAVLSRVRSLNFCENDILAISLSLQEALTNAIQHGNNLDPLKSVHVRFRACRKKVRIEVEDEGDGFRQEDVPDPTEEENLSKPSGRGILLMMTYMSEVEYNNIGNRVILMKYRGTSFSGHG